MAAAAPSQSAGSQFDSVAAHHWAPIRGPFSCFSPHLATSSIPNIGTARFHGHPSCNRHVTSLQTETAPEPLTARTPLLRFGGGCPSISWAWAAARCIAAGFARNRVCSRASRSSTSSLGSGWLEDPSRPDPRPQSFRKLDPSPLGPTSLSAFSRKFVPWNFVHSPCHRLLAQHPYDKTSGSHFRRHALPRSTSCSVSRQRTPPCRLALSGIDTPRVVVKHRVAGYTRSRNRKARARRGTLASGQRAKDWPIP